MKHLIIVPWLFVFFGCGHYESSLSGAQLITVSAASTANRLDSLVRPYRDSLAVEMGQVIGHAEHDFSKGRPNGSLNNWAADAVLTAGQAFMNPEAPVVVLLNVGGLRNTINKGAVTVGDIYKLMPFDNEVVCVEMPWSSLTEIQDYLLQSGGEPVAGMILSEGELVLNDTIRSDSFWVITSDYLMLGGDKMNFFSKQLRHVYPGMLLRDLFIEAVRKQKVMIYSDEKRIQL